MQLNHLLYSVVLVIVSVFMLVTCQDEDPWPRKNRLETSTVSITFNAVDTFRIVYIASDLDINLRVTGNWIHPVRGTNARGMDSLVVTVDNYTNKTTDRYDTIVVSSGVAKDKRIVVRQNYLRDSLLLVPDSIPYEIFQKGTVEVAVMTDAVNGWEFTNTTQSDWIKLAKSADNKSLLVTVDELWYGNAMRSAQVSVRTNPMQSGLATTTRTLNITQLVTPTVLSVNPEAITFAAGATSSQSVTVNTDAESWDLEYDQSEVDWLIFEKGADGKTLKVSVAGLWDGGASGDPRVAYITVVSGSTRTTLRVMQNVTSNQ